VEDKYCTLVLCLSGKNKPKFNSYLALNETADRRTLTDKEKQTLRH